MASSIAAARVNLHGLLTAATWPAPKPQVTFGAPDVYEEQEVVSLLGIQDADEEFAALGAARHAESYLLEVGVKAHGPGATAQVVDGRGFALADTVRGVVHANPTFPPDTVLPAVVVSQTSDGAQAAEGGGWVCFIRLLVRCQTRIT